MAGVVYWSLQTIATGNPDSSHVAVGVDVADKCLYVKDNLGNVAKFTTTTNVQSLIDASIAALVASAPGALDTLNELAAALGNDPNFATSVASSLALKADKSTQVIAGTGLTGGGDLSANRTLSLSDVGTAGTYGSASSVPSITTDAKGRVTGVTTIAIAVLSSAITDFAAAVRATVLTGLSTATNATISATDSILSALGKLQAQITANLGTLTSHTSNTSNPHATTAAQVGADPTGTASAAIAAHVAAVDPHTQYTTTAEAAAAAPVQSVFGRTGAVIAATNDYSAAQINGLGSFILAQLLTGLAAGTNTAIAATNSILTAFQNLQAQITNLSTVKADKTTTISAGTGLTGGGDLSANRTISMPNVGTAGTYGSASSVPVITTDAQGRVSSVTSTSISLLASAISDFASTVRSTVLTGLAAGTNTAITATDSVLSAFQNLQAQVSNLLSVKADKATTISAGTSLNGGGDLSANRTINHSNFGTAGTYGSASSVPVITTEATGHVTGVTNTPIIVAQSQVTGLTTSLAGKANLAGGNTFTGNQNFGAGLVNIPAAPLNLVNSSAGTLRTQLNLVNGGGGGGAGSAIDFHTYDDQPTSTQPGGRIGAIDDNFSAYFSFLTKIPGAPANLMTERMRITNDGRVGINAIPSASAILQADSTTQGFLLPRMTTVQRNAIASPAAGLMVYDTDVKAFFAYDSSIPGWVKETNATGLPGEVRSTVLTGIDTTTQADVLATDSVLSAIGKLAASDKVWTELVVTTALTSTSNITLTNISELAFPVTNGKRYRIECQIMFQSAATTTGIGLTMGTTGAAGELAMTVQALQGADGTASQFGGAVTAFGDTVVSASVPAANTSYMATIEGVFVCTTSGTLTPQFRSEVLASQVSVRIGSNILVREF